MKAPKTLAPLMWLTNAAALVLGLVVLFQVHADAQQSLKAAIRAGDEAVPSARLQWQDTVGSTDHGSFESRLSPIARPVIETDPDPITPIIVPPEKTDAELQAELEAALNRTFTLLRIFHGEDAELFNSATMVSGGVRIHLFVGSNLAQMFKDARNANVRALALDITVVSIGADHIVLDAPSFERADKRFQITLHFRPESIAR